MDHRIRKTTIDGPQHKPRRHASTGFTLLEIVVVLLILVMLTGLVAPQIVKRLTKARTDTAKVQIQSLGAAVGFYAIDMGACPVSPPGLTALVRAPPGVTNWAGPYVQKQDSLLDPWGRPYVYRCPGEHGDFDILSLGADGLPGGSGDAQDIASW